MTVEQSAKIEEVFLQIKRCAIEVYNELGSQVGRDDIYDACLRRELHYQGVAYFQLKPLPFFYKGERLDDVLYGNYLIAEDCVLVETDSFNFAMQGDKGYLLAHLTQTGKKAAAILNFSVSNSEGIMTRVNLKDLV